ncbi:hypothetical protein AB833_00375 [Chromatiales bacterium (ex Bugula neritina AB1)]|nr:hypothetical protein AB833_00375 [Chromatiales bacterium (ex Bugula neritina AB1)]
MNSESTVDETAHRGSIESPLPGIYFGFDFGTKRIGIAKGHTETQSASPLTVIRNINDRPDWERLDTLISVWLPVGLIVGLPLSDQGNPQILSAQSNAFAKKIGKRYSLPVHRCDERYSSIEASKVLAQHRQLGIRQRKVQRSHTDEMAAAIILENWLCGTMNL